MNKQRKFSIIPVGDKSFNLGFQWLVLGMVFLSGFTVLVVNSFVFVESPHSVDAMTTMLGKIQNSFFARSFATLFIILIFSYFILLVYSHRIAGPLHRLRNVLEKANKGHLNQTITFRKGDHFEEIGNLLNDLLKKMERIKADVTAIEVQVGDKKNHPLNQDQLKKIEDQINDIKNQFES